MGIVTKKRVNYSASGYFHERIKCFLERSKIRIGFIFEFLCLFIEIFEAIVIILQYTLNPLQSQSDLREFQPLVTSDGPQLDIRQRLQLLTAEFLIPSFSVLLHHPSVSLSANTRQVSVHGHDLQRPSFLRTAIGSHFSLVCDKYIEL